MSTSCAYLIKLITHECFLLVGLGVNAAEFLRSGTFGRAAAGSRGTLEMNRNLLRAATSVM